MRSWRTLLWCIALMCLSSVVMAENVNFKGDKLTNGTLQGVTTIQLHAAPAVTSRPSAGFVFTWMTVDRDGNMVINYRGAAGDDKVYTGVLWSAITSMPSIITSIANQTSLSTLNTALQAYDAAIVTTIRTKTMQTLNTALQAYDADIVNVIRTKTLATLKTTLDSYSGDISTASFAIGEQAVQSRTVSIQLKDGSGSNVAYAGVVTVYLSDAATGLDITATAPSGGVALGSAGKVLAAITAGKLLKVASSVNGGVDVILTEAAAKSFYIVCVLPNGRIVVSAEVAFTAAG